MSYCMQAVRSMANHRHKKVIKQAKGYRGRANRCYSVAFHRVQKAQQYAYRDRKVMPITASMPDILLRIFLIFTCFLFYQLNIDGDL